MRNQALATAVGFDPILLSETSFQNRWPVFRDGENCKFLRLFMEKRITELQGLLENCDTDQMAKLQGQLVEARKLAGFLAQPNITNEVTSMRAWLK